MPSHPRRHLVGARAANSRGDQRRGRGEPVADAAAHDGDALRADQVREGLEELPLGVVDPMNVPARGDAIEPGQLVLHRPGIIPIDRLRVRPVLEPTLTAVEGPEPGEILLRPPLVPGLPEAVQHLVNDHRVEVPIVVGDAATVDLPKPSEQRGALGLEKFRQHEASGDPHGPRYIGRLDDPLVEVGDVPRYSGASLREPETSPRRSHSVKSMSLPRRSKTWDGLPPASQAATSGASRANPSSASTSRPCLLGAPGWSTAAPPGRSRSTKLVSRYRKTVSSGAAVSRVAGCANSRCSAVSKNGFHADA